MGLKSYRELEVWQTAMSLACEIYGLLKEMPKEERYALSDQLRRASVSVVSNIAEGFGRESTKDLLHFIAMARGSLYELETQLELAQLVGLLTLPETIVEKTRRIAMMLNALSSKLKSRLNSSTSHEPRTTSHEND